MSRHVKRFTESPGDMARGACCIATIQRWLKVARFGGREVEQGKREFYWRASERWSEVFACCSINSSRCRYDNVYCHGSA
jgi:hypothetical protein